jgi:signal transduction histidine kinase
MVSPVPLKKRWTNISVTFFSIALLVLLAVAVFWILNQIQIKVDERLASSLQVVLHTTDKALRNWAQQTEVNAAVLADNDEFLTDVEVQLRTPRDAKSLLASSALKDIRRLLEPAMKFYQFPGFVVIARDGIQIAAQRDNIVGTSEIFKHNYEAFRNAMEGKTSLGLPFRSGLVVDETTHREYAIMTACAPIRNQRGDVIAVLALLLDPRRGFSRAAQLGRLETTGETYVFDNAGRLLTESRFEDELREIGLIPADADSILNLEIRDPGGNVTEGYKPAIPRNQQPLTRMAQSATRGNSGIDLHGYRDYRGIPVIGAWLWDSQLGMGLATEMNVNEAFRTFRRVRELVLALLFLMMAVSVGLLLIFRRRERLSASNAALEQALQARDDMMAIVAHDLKNPLNTVILRCHVMLQMLEKPEDLDEVRRNLHSQQRTALHMSQLINDLTDVAKIQAARLHVELRESRVEQAIGPVIERARLLAREKGIEFVTNIDSPLPPVLVDPGRITQIMDNLFGNALKFTPSGERITVNVLRLQREIQVSVADTGTGIPSDALSRIFEPYWQVQKTRSGMGLGLFIARTLVEAHGGRMWVESTLGRGTTFYFTLPSPLAADTTPLSGLKAG